MQAVVLQVPAGHVIRRDALTHVALRRRRRPDFVRSYVTWGRSAASQF